MKLYYFLGFLLKPFAVAGFFLYGHLTHTPRVRVVVQNEKNQLLLVRSWLSGKEWNLPGGGVDSGEEPARAAQRELEEETGVIAAASELVFLFSLRSFGHDEIVYTTDVHSRTVSGHIPNRFEIQEMAWFSRKDLPKLDSLTGRIIQKMDDGR